VCVVCETVEPWSFRKAWVRRRQAEPQAGCRQGRQGQVQAAQKPAPGTKAWVSTGPIHSSAHHEEEHMVPSSTGPPRSALPSAQVPHMRSHRHHPRVQHIVTRLPSSENTAKSVRAQEGRRKSRHSQIPPGVVVFVRSSPATARLRAGVVFAARKRAVAPPAFAATPSVEGIPPSPVERPAGVA